MDSSPSQLIVTNQFRPIVINNVHVKGIVNTNHSFLKEITAPLLEAGNLGDAIIGSRNVAQQLKSLDIFQDVSVSLEASDTASQDGPDGVDVVFQVKEAPRLYAHTGADFGSNDGSMHAALKLRNALGNAETLSIKTTHGVENSSTDMKKDKLFEKMQGSSAKELILSKPLQGNTNRMLTLTLFELDRNHTSLRSFQEKLKGLSLKLSHAFPWSHVTWLGGYDAAWRENHSIASDASLSIRNDAGHSFKSGIFHEIVRDTREDSVFPTTGSYLKFAQELAGLGGDVSFIKNELHALFARGLGLGMNLALTARAGLLHPFAIGSIKRSTSMVNDRFQLGGPTTLRGFQQDGVGPRDKRRRPNVLLTLDDAIGGNAYYAAGATFSFPLPILSPNYFRGQFFANAGTLVQTVDWSGIAKRDLQTLSNVSSAAGAGLVVRFAGFRLEMNYCVPLRITTTDKVKPGFQFGIGMHFM
ncbi:hypothetical protein HDU91_001239 [Kappamyces sp. JEL0680]|nr:hypothetical protein HDU91_001239 [Kappamyces sp. JEL0680]